MFRFSSGSSSKIEMLTTTKYFLYCTTIINTAPNVDILIKQEINIVQIIVFFIFFARNPFSTSSNSGWNQRVENFEIKLITYFINIPSYQKFSQEKIGKCASRKFFNIRISHRISFSTFRFQYYFIWLQFVLTNWSGNFSEKL
jgi:hypothetical protein